MLEHRKTSNNSLPVGQEEAAARITPGVTAELETLDRVDELLNLLDLLHVHADLK